ncbi:MAG: hypothetical protein WAX77_07065 [Methylococcaceae bacterium]
MKAIATLAVIRTPRMLKGFRACVTLTGRSQILSELGRVYAAEYQRLNRVQHAKSKRVV